MTLRIGIDLGGTKIEASRSTPPARCGRASACRRRATTTTAPSTAIAGLVDAARARAGEPGTVGVGMPGAISPATGLVKNANSTWLNGRPLQRDLDARLGRPVRLANDANCFALSEATDGAGGGRRRRVRRDPRDRRRRRRRRRRRVVTGPNAIAGEWGHNPLPWPRDDERPGPPCYCGRRGCIETFLSGPAVAQDYAAAAGPRRGGRA